MSTPEEELKKSFPDATEAECRRFVQGCRDGKRDDDAVKEAAEIMLENYLDFRSLYGLDYSGQISGTISNKDSAIATVTENGGGEATETTGEDDTDTSDWNIAAKKALQVAESIVRERKLAKERAANEWKERWKRKEVKKETKDDPYADIEAKLDDTSNNSAQEKTEDDNVGTEKNSNTGEKSEGDNEKSEGDNKKSNEADGLEAEEVKTEDDGETKKSSVAEEDGKANGEDEAVEGKIEANTTLQTLPQLLFDYKSADGKSLVDKSGKRILHVLPAQINRRALTAEMTALAFAFYLDRKFDRNSDEKVTVCIDVRPGEGWSNPLAISMVNHVRKIAGLLQTHFPERLERLIIYPIPKIGMAAWNAAKVFMWSATMDKVVLAPGPAGLLSPVPEGVIQEHLDKEVLDQMEKIRKDHFN